MKKLLLAMLITVLSLALFACGSSGTDTTADEGTTPPAVGDEHVHEFVEEIIPATCTTVGKAVNKCSCGEVESESEIPLADHTASTLDCEKDTVCTVCNTVLAEKTGHIFSAAEIVTPASCATVGKEKGVCVACGKIVETEIPATGHVMGGAITIANGAFTSTCSVCSQSVTLKADAPALLIDFEDDIAAQVAKSDMGLSVHKPEAWPVTDVEGSKAIVLPGATSLYINIDDPSKLTALGTFVISFDYTTTKEVDASATMGSAISILSNCYSGTKTDAGSIGWGWLMKVGAGKIATTNKPADFTAENSVDAKVGTKHTVNMIVTATSKPINVFVDGTYIGAITNIPEFASLAAKNACFRFGDGPDCGHVFDNFAISALK